MTRVEVDFSTTVRGGLIRASLRRVESGAQLAEGDRVEAFDEDEGLEFTGFVDHIDGDFAYLRMDWVAAAPPTSPSPDQWLQNINVRVADSVGLVFALAPAAPPVSASAASHTTTLPTSDRATMAPA